MIEPGALAGALDGVGHDLRGPLGTILGNVEVLREGIHGPLPPGVEAHLVAIEAAGRAFLARLDGALAELAGPRGAPGAPVGLTAAGALAPDPAGPPARLRVLVIDDVAGDVVADLLRARGFEVQVADAGLPGLARAAAHGPDVVLLDLGLPDLDGLEVARRLRALPGGADLVVLALTGRDPAEVDGQGLLDGVLGKPLGGAALAAALAAARAARGGRAP